MREDFDVAIVGAGVAGLCLARALRALGSRWPSRMPGIFAALFSRVPADAVPRFLDERASWRELLTLVARLPMRPFVGALFVWLGRRLRFGRRR